MEGILICCNSPCPPHLRDTHRSQGWREPSLLKHLESCSGIHQDLVSDLLCACERFLEPPRTDGTHQLQMGGMSLIN